MDFDPNATPEERKRSGPRWYSVVAFLVIAFLLLLNAVAIFGNAEANSEQACYTRVLALAELYGNEGRDGYRKFSDWEGQEVSDLYNWCHDEYFLD